MTDSGVHQKVLVKLLFTDRAEQPTQLTGGRWAGFCNVLAVRDVISRTFLHHGGTSPCGWRDRNLIPQILLSMCTTPSRPHHRSPPGSAHRRIHRRTHHRSGDRMSWCSFDISLCISSAAGLLIKCTFENFEKGCYLTRSHVSYRRLSPCATLVVFKIGWPLA